MRRDCGRTNWQALHCGRKCAMRFAAIAGAYEPVDMYVADALPLEISSRNGATYTAR